MTNANGPTYRLGASVLGHYAERDPNRWPSMADAVRSIASVERGFGVEVWAAKAVDGPPIDGPGLDRLIEACRDAAFVTAHIRGTFWHWNPVDLRTEIDFAARVGASSLVLHPICLGLRDPDDRLDVPEIRRIADYAATRGVVLALENVENSMTVLDRVLDEIGDRPDRTNLALCIDIGHAHLSTDAGREPVINYVERYAGPLIHLHLHDNSGTGDDHLIPGRGTIDWPRLLDTLDRIGFSGTAVLELQGEEPEPLAAIEEGLLHLRAARR